MLQAQRLSGFDLQALIGTRLERVYGACDPLKLSKPYQPPGVVDQVAKTMMLELNPVSSDRLDLFEMREDLLIFSLVLCATYLR
jgi:hypothetical protein